MNGSVRSLFVGFLLICLLASFFVEGDQSYIGTYLGESDVRMFTIEKNGKGTIHRDIPHLGLQPGRVRWSRIDDLQSIVIRQGKVEVNMVVGEKLADEGYHVANHDLMYFISREQGRLTGIEPFAIRVHTDSLGLRFNAASIKSH